MQQVRWGVLGCANIARKAFLPAVKESGNGLALAIASRDQAKATAWAAEFGIERAYGSYEALLADPDIDAVYIPLPNSLHGHWIERAAEAGKHIFCEKPLTIDAAEAARVLETCERLGVKLFEAFVYRFQPQTALVRELVDQQKIGRAISAHAQFHFTLRERVYNVRMQADLAGGALMDVGCYCIDWARWLFGRPNAVYARATSERAVDTTCQGLLEFPGGERVTFSASFDVVGGQKATIYGTGGLIELSTPWHPRGQDATLVLRAGEAEEVHAVSADLPPFTPAVQAFAEAVLTGASLPVSADEGLENMRVIDALQESMRTGRRVEIA